MKEINLFNLITNIYDNYKLYIIALAILIAVIFVRKLRKKIRRVYYKFRRLIKTLIKLYLI